jgi:hypothetical protein
VTDLVPVRNLGLAPKDTHCWICQNIRASEDVTARAFDPSGDRQETTEAVAYLVSIGIGGSKSTLQRRVRAHAKHLEQYAARPYPLVPGKSAITIIPPHSNWLAATQGAVDLGMEAQRDLATRLSQGYMQDKDVISLARLGIVAATKQGDLEAKGKSLKQVDRLLMLAAGLPQDVIDVESTEVE